MALKNSRKSPETVSRNGMVRRKKANAGRRPVAGATPRAPIISNGSAGKGNRTKRPKRKLTKARLHKLARKSQPPQSWYDEQQDLF